MSARRRGTVFLRALLVALAVSGSVVASPDAARAGGAEPELALLAQPAWVPVGGDVLLRLDIPASLLPADEEASLRLRIHNAVTTTTAFERTIEGERLGNRIDDTYTTPVSGLIRDAQGAAYLAFGLTGSTRTPMFAVRGPGVYPLEVALRTDETLASFVTWIVVADPAGTVVTETPPQPVRTASVWNLVSAPVRDVDGEVDAAALRDMSPGGRLDDVATLLADADTMPLSIQAGPETVEAWDALAQTNPRLAPGLARVEAAIARSTTQLLPAPYVPIDLTSLEAAGLGAELPDALRAGSEALARATGARPDSRTAVVDPIDAAALTRVQGLLVDPVVVRGTALAGDDPTPLAPFAIGIADTTMRAAATSPGYEELLQDDASAGLRAQRLLAALSVLAFEREDPSGVVLGTPIRWRPDIATQREVIAGMRDHPYIEPTTLDELFAVVPAAASDSGSVVRQLAPHDPAPFPVTAARYQRAQLELASLRSSVGPEDPGNVRGEQGLALALSTDNSAEEAEKDLAVITDAADALQGGVSTAPRRVTVTARKADIPLTFLNTTGKAVDVRVELASEKLLFPEGAARVVTLIEGSTTERFSVEARTSGSFTMMVTLESADGNLRLGAPQRVSVRSGVFSGAGAALTVGALLFLALWWANHFRRTRRARRAAAAP